MNSPEKSVFASGKIYLYVAWFQALAATLGSLLFSEILHFPPCVLCWYQRICMYPLVIILGLGILLKDRFVAYYAGLFIAIGWIISLYHNLLYYNILSESAAPCIAGVSCTTKFIEVLGFVTIPFLSLTAFTIMGACMLLYWRAKQQNESK